MKNLIYVPSISVGTMVLCIRGDRRFANERFRFYNKGSSPIYHPHIMISMAYCFDLHGKNLRDVYKMDEDVVVYGDSGGFQVISSSKDTLKNLTPENILNMLETHCNIGLILDIPPKRPWNHDSSEIEYYNYALQTTYNNAKYFYENRQGKCKLLNVLQGRPGAGLKKWYHTMKNFDFDGWAVAANETLSVKSIQKPQTAALTGTQKTDGHVLADIFYLMQNGEFEKSNNKYLHILGVGSMYHIVTFIFFQHMLNRMGYDIQVTVDASNVSLISGYGRAIIADAVVNMIRYDSCIDYSSVYDMPLPCDCPVCRDLLISDISDFGTHQYAYITLHNLYVQLRRIEFFNRFFDITTRLGESGFGMLTNISNKTVKKLRLISEAIQSKTPYDTFIANASEVFRTTESVQTNIDTSSLF